MISKLETIYGAYVARDYIASYDVVMQNYYKISMDPKEHHQAYVTRMEGALNQIRTKFPYLLNDKDMETHLRDRLSYWIINALYDNDKITYAELLIACQKLKLKLETPNYGHQ